MKSKFINEIKNLQKLAGLLKEEEDFDLSDNPLAPNKVPDVFAKFLKNHGLAPMVYVVLYENGSGSGLYIIEEGWKTKQDWITDQLQFMEDDEVDIEDSYTLYDRDSLEMGDVYYESFEQALSANDIEEESDYVKEHGLKGVLAASVEYTTELIYIKP